MKVIEHNVKKERKL